MTLVWNPAQYLKFAGSRTRAAADLLPPAKHVTVCILLGLVMIGCGRPSPQPSTRADSDSYESAAHVPMGYFPMEPSDSNTEMVALLRRVEDTEGKDIQLPEWMSGSWRIQGSREYAKAEISPRKLDLMEIEVTPDPKEIQRGRDLGLPASRDFPRLKWAVVRAGTSPSSRLLAIYGSADAADTGALYAGYMVIKKRQGSSGPVVEWIFAVRNVGYGIGVYSRDPETWTFTRISP